jgi:DNA invertase Pin-like site-specific DNA recombinase
VVIGFPANNQQEVTAMQASISKDAAGKQWLAHLYLRLSKEDGDKEESNSITGQRELLRSYAQNMSDITVVGEKVDDGFSGVSFQRPAFIEMMEDIRAGNVNCVIVKDLSRFGRNFGEAGKYIEHVFPFLGVRFIAVNDGIDTMAEKSRSDDIVVPFLNLINDAYCRDISIKIRSQLEVKRRKGDFVGAFPVFGYMRDEKNRNRLIIDKTAADVVQLIFRWKLDGQSAAMIADRLNTMGIPSPMEYKKSQGGKFSTPFAKSGKTLWSPVAVFRVLRDETYTGTLVQGKCGTPNHKIRKKLQKPEADWARVDGIHEAIIPAEDFRLVARLLERDTRTSPGGSSVHPFSGMARCGLCGENMIRKTSHAGGKKYVYFVCCRGCKGARVSEESLTESAEAAIRFHITAILNLERILNFIDTLPLKRDEVQKLDGQIAAKRDELAHYDRMTFSLYESRENGVITHDEYRQMKARYNALRDEAELAMNNLSREIEGILSHGGEKNQWIEHFRQFQDFTELTRRMVVSLVDVITVHPGSRLEILFRYRYDYESALRFTETVAKLHALPKSITLKEAV